jgi:hypothetical protein
MRHAGSFQPDHANGTDSSRWRSLVAPIVLQLVLVALAAVFAGLYLFPIR